MRFMANFKYTFRDSNSPLVKAEQYGPDYFTGVRQSDYDKFDSHCHKTMVGFVLNNNAIVK
jgi:hypothetical protein